MNRSRGGDGVKGFSLRSRFIFTALAGVALVYTLVPFLWMIINSTKSNADLFSTASFALGDNNFLVNMGQLFTHDGGIFSRWLLNTLFYSTTAALGATALCFLAGYAFSKWSFPGRSWLFSAIVIVIMIPNTALAIPTYQMLSAFNLVNNPLALILPSLLNPFGLYLMKLYIDGALPDEVLDAARIDGASEARILRSIVPRIVTPGLATVFLLSFVATWNNYLLPLLVFTDSQLYPVTLGLTTWNRQSIIPLSTDQAIFPLVILGSLVSVIPLIVAFTFLQRFVKSGLAVGAVR